MDRSVTDNGTLIDDFQGLIERALGYGNGTHEFEDVRRMVLGGEAHFWPGVGSCIVTEFIDSPRKRFINFFLAAGNLRELEAMTPIVLEWAKEKGCTHAIMTGRLGWTRTKLMRDWKVEDAIIMEKTL